MWFSFRCRCCCCRSANSYKEVCVVQNCHTCQHFVCYRGNYFLLFFSSKIIMANPTLPQDINYSLHVVFFYALFLIFIWCFFFSFLGIRTFLKIKLMPEIYDMSTHTRSHAINFVKKWDTVKCGSFQFQRMKISLASVSLKIKWHKIPKEGGSHQSQ